MKHPRRIGRAITDKNMKFLKKLIKKNPIIFDGKINKNEDCEIRVTNIRKYENYFNNRFDNDKFVYEIDVQVTVIKKSPFYWYDSKTNLYKNRRVRGYGMEKLFENELCYFGIKDFCISKISYE